MIERIILVVTALFLTVTPVFASQTAGKTVADLPPAAQMAVAEAMGRDDATYHATREGAGFRLQAGGELAARFDREGAEVSGWRLSPAAIGRGRELRPLAPVKPEVRANRVEYRRDTVTEWYVNGPLGLEQGFTLQQPPRTDGAGPLTLALRLPDGMTLAIAKNRTDLALTSLDNSTSLGYNKLAAWDATGRQLAAWFEPGTGRQMLIRVDDSGAAYPVTVDPLLEKQKLAASDSLAGDYFGCSVSLSSDGNTALIGAMYKNSGAGVAYIFTRNASGWTEQKKLIASDSVASDYFGNSVSLSGDGATALVGAFIKDSSTGAAYVFTRSGSVWTEQKKLTASDGATADYFGKSVSLSSDGNTALVGAYNKNSQIGAAYIFTRSGSTWTEQRIPTASDAAAYDGFGISGALSSDGTTALIGAGFKNSSTGAAYVYIKYGTTWTEQRILTASDAAAYDRFGTSVTLNSDGTTALVGKNTYISATYVFVRSGDSWTEQQKLTASDATGNDGFGYSVSLSSDGSTALVGAADKNSYTGAAYLFTRSGAIWTEQQKLSASDGAQDDRFGSSVSLNSAGNTALVGALGKNSFTGAAYVFAPPPEWCGDGQYDFLGVCTPCPADSYQVAGSHDSCQSCPAGLYQPLTGQSSCLRFCMAGQYDNGSVCTQCPAGQYQNVAGLNKSCIPAPAGTFAASAGAAQPAPCSAGFFQDQTGSALCKACPVGYLQPSTGQSFCFPSPPGAFVATEGASQPVPCSAGTYQDLPGSALCKACPVGYLQPSTGQSSCFPAPPGTFVAVTGASQPVPCSAGYYQDLTGSASCKACSVGYLQPSTGQSYCFPAPPGTYVSAEGSSQPVPCSTGYYQDQPGSALCNACPAGTLQPAIGQAACTPIPKAVAGVAFDPLDLSKLFAGIDNAGIYFSLNGGTDWLPATTQPANNRVKSVVLKPGDSTKQFAATYGGGVYASTNSGVDWSACAEQPTNLNVVSLTIDATGKLYAGSEAGVFTSSDNCTTWTALNSGLP